jgi:hypothetical protein
MNICELLDIGKSELIQTEEPSTRESKTHICELLNIPFIYLNNNILPQCKERGLKARNATISRMNQMKCIMRVGDLAYALLSIIGSYMPKQRGANVEFNRFKQF